MTIHGRRTFFGVGVLIVIVILLRSTTCGSDAPRPEQSVVGRRLNLQDFQQVRDTDVFRAQLVDNSGGYSGSERTRNILFVDASGAARWLLPGDDQVVEEHAVSPTKERPWVPEPDAAAVAIVALAKPLHGQVEEGTLYILDPTGRTMVVIADHVRSVHGTTLTTQGAAVMYEGSGRYVLAHYDVATLKKLREVEVTVPALRGGPTTR